MEDNKITVIKDSHDKIENDLLCFDIGANVGLWSIKNIVIFKNIIAVEPSSKTFETLVKNCADKNIICLNYAVSNEDKETIDFYESPDISKVYSTINKDWFYSDKSRFYGMGHTATTCKSITLDRLIEQYGTPVLIKIDVEGAENLVIFSLTKKVEVLCFEWAREFHNITRQSIDHLLKIGFKRFCIQYEDDYSYYPKEEDFIKDLEILEYKLTNVGPNWGMVWAI